MPKVCVIVDGVQEPIRVTVEEAFQIVEREDRGEYCPRRLWKELTRDVNKSKTTKSE